MCLRIAEDSDGANEDLSVANCIFWPATIKDRLYGLKSPSSSQLQLGEPQIWYQHEVCRSGLLQSRRFCFLMMIICKFHRPVLKHHVDILLGDLLNCVPTVTNLLSIATRTLADHICVGQIRLILRCYKQSLYCGMLCGLASVY